MCGSWSGGGAAGPAVRLARGSLRGPAAILPENLGLGCLRRWPEPAQVATQGGRRICRAWVGNNPGHDRTAGQTTRGRWRRADDADLRGRSNLRRGRLHHSALSLQPGPLLCDSPRMGPAAGDPDEPTPLLNGRGLNGRGSMAASTRSPTRRRRLVYRCQHTDTADSWACASDLPGLPIRSLPCRPRPGRAGGGAGHLRRAAGGLGR